LDKSILNLNERLKVYAGRDNSFIHKSDCNGLMGYESDGIGEGLMASYYDNEAF